MEGVIDYTEQFITIIEELEKSRELQVMAINNSVETLKIGFIVLGLFVGIILGAFFIKVVFK